MRFILIISLLFCFTGCNPKAENGKPLIVCSTSIIADCVKNVVGDEYEVVALMGPEIDPHSYNPRPSDSRYLSDADVIIYNGFHLEGKMAELFEHLNTRKTVMSIAEYYPKEKKIQVDAQGAIDPHIWFDPIAWMKGIEGVKNELKSKYSKDASLFETNFQNFNAKITAEYFRLKKLLTGIPEEQRVIITSHDAFHYFGRAFNCKVKAIQGTSTTQEPSIQSMLNLQQYILDHHINALFVESSVNPKSISTIIENCRSRGHQLKIGGTLYSDALGAKKAKTYFSMLHENCHTIYNALKR